MSLSEDDDNIDNEYPIDDDVFDDAHFNQSNQRNQQREAESETEQEQNQARPANYFGSNVDNLGHYQGATTQNDLSRYQPNVYGHYMRATSLISFDDIKGLPLTYYPFLEKFEGNDYQFSNKIILPSKILEIIAKYDGINYPLTFRIDGIQLFLGVIDFDNTIEYAYIPNCIFEQLAILNPEMDYMNLSPVNLGLKLYNRPIARGTKAIIRSHNPRFIEIENYRDYLQSSLQYYSMLQENTTIEIGEHPLINVPIKFDIIKTFPEKNILITDTDLEIDFEEPLGYKEYLEELEKQKIQKEKERLEKERERLEKEKLELKQKYETDYWGTREKEHIKKYKCLPVPFEYRNGQMVGRLNFNYQYRVP
jgi:hypothetical protein